MSQMKGLEILRCVALLKLFSKKRNRVGPKNYEAKRPHWAGVSWVTELESVKRQVSCLLWFCRPYRPPILDAILKYQSRTSTRTAVCYEPRYCSNCCSRGISRLRPASPKSAFIKNEQKAKTKTFSLRSKWPQNHRLFTADSPPFHRTFKAVQH
jgi:hypothetical protein